MTSSSYRFFLLSIVLLLGAVLLCCSKDAQDRNPKTDQAQREAKAPVGLNPPDGWIDMVAGDPVVGGKYTLAGWAADQHDGAPVARLEVLVDDKVIGQGTLGGERPDVAKVNSRPDYTNSGWVAYVTLAGVSPGKHRLSVVAYNSLGVSGVLRGAREIDVVSGR